MSTQSDRVLTGGPGVLGKAWSCGAALALLTGCSALIHVPGLPPARPEALERAFTPEELTEDTRQFFALLEEIHPDPYRTVPRDDPRSASGRAPVRYPRGVRPASRHCSNSSARNVSQATD